MNVKLKDLMNLRNKTILVGGDHHAHDHAVAVYQYLSNNSIKTELVNYNSSACFDYLDQSKLVAARVSQDPVKYAGIIGCKSGFGASLMSAKYPHVFCIRCDGPHQAKMARQVNYCNVLAFGSDFVDKSELNQTVEAWLNTNFELNTKNKNRYFKILKIQQEATRFL